MNLDFSRLIEVDILSINQSRIPCIIQSNTNEKLQIKLKEKKELYNLTGCEVKYEIVKPNGSTHEGEVDVTVPTSGFGIIYLTEDVLNVVGVHKINLDIITPNKQIKVKGLKYEVIPNEDNFNDNYVVDSEEDTADKNNIVSEESSDSDTNNSTTVGKDISYINNEVSLIRQHELDIDFDNFSRKSSNASFMLGEMNTSEIIANLKRSNISIDLTRLDVSINIKGKSYDLEKIPCEKLDAENGKILIKIPNKFINEVAENSFNVYLQDGERILKSPTFTYKIIDTLQDGIPGDDIELSYLQAKIVEVQQMGDTIEDLKDKFNKAVANVTNGNESATNTEIVLARGDNATLGERLDSSEEKISVLGLQLDNIKNKISICPDDLDFESDDEKIQHCLDLAKSKNIEILLNRVYTTKNTFNVDKGYDNFILFKGCNGGGLHKEGDGFMFSSGFDDNKRGNIHFEDVHFTGESGRDNTIIDADRMIRIFFNHCTFKYIKCIKSSTRYLQTLRFTRNIVEEHNGNFIDINCCFDTKINNNQVEASYNGNFLRIHNTSRTGFEYYSLIIDDNLFEGYANSAVLSLSNCGTNLSICKNYFEGNKCEIEFTQTKLSQNITSLGVTRQFTFDNNLVFKGSAGGDNVFTGIENMRGCKVFINNNEIQEKKIFNTIGGLIDIYGRETNSFFMGAALSSEAFPNFGTERQSVYGKVVKEYKEGVGAKIILRDFLQGSFVNRGGETLLLNVRVDYQANNVYFNNYLGIISFTGEYDSSNSKTCLRLYQTDLFNKSGNTGGASCGVTVTFGDGSLKVPNQGEPTNRDLVINVSSAKTIANAQISVIPLSQILLSSNSYLYRS